MKPAPLSPELSSAAPALAGRLGAICLGLAALIARAFLRNPARVALILPLWNRLKRTATRFDRLLARIVEGKDRPRPPRARARDAIAPARPKIAFPAPHGWLLTDLRHEAALYTNRLDRLLSEPETVALIAHSPRLLRLLRPLCHMLGVRNASLGVRNASLGVRNAAVPPGPCPRNRPAAPPATHHPAGPGLIESALATRPSPPTACRPPPPRPDTDPCPHVLRWPWLPWSPARAL